MSNRSDPVKQFFEPENISTLYDTLKQDIARRVNIDIGSSYLEPLINTMKLVVRPLQNQPIPKNVNARKFVMTLNKKTLMEAIPIFIKNLSKVNQNRHISQDARSTESGGPPSFRHEHGNVARNQGLDQGSNRSANYDVQLKYKQIADNRISQEPAPKFIPKFQDDVPEYTDRVDDLYEAVEKQRANSDILPPPSDDNPWLQEIAANASDRPVQVLMRPQTYQPAMQPAQMQTAQMQTAQMQPAMQPAMQTAQMQTAQMQTARMAQPNPDVSFQQNVDGHMSTNIQDLQNSINVATIPQTSIENAIRMNQSVFDTAYATQAAEQQQFAYDPPQPAQIRTLIPKNFRGVVEKNDMIPQILTIDSRQRDHNKYPNPNDYRIDLPNEFKNVTSVELSSAEIPITGYVVNERNNVLHFEEEEGIILEAELKVGNYLSDDLGLEIANKMTLASPNGIRYGVHNDQTQNRFTIVSAAESPYIFNLRFFGGDERGGDENEPGFRTTKKTYLDRSIGRVIGFDPVDQTGAFEYGAPHGYNLGGESYLLLIIKELDMIKTRTSSQDSAFAKIVIDCPLRDVKFYNSKVDTPYIKYPEAPIGRLGHLTVEFRTFDGELYDFNGHKHSFTLVIKSVDITKAHY